MALLAVGSIRFRHLLISEMYLSHAATPMGPSLDGVLLVFCGSAAWSAFWGAVFAEVVRLLATAVGAASAGDVVGAALSTGAGDAVRSAVVGGGVVACPAS
ncbi:MAG: hypothetical protein U0441_32445 [Polyangiaceae bacterium]